MSRPLYDEAVLSDENTDYIERALEDLHKEFINASSNLDAMHNGPVKTADQRITLIRAYSEAVARVLKEGFQ